MGKLKSKVVEETLKRQDLVDEWIIRHHKKMVQLNVSDICIEDPIHKQKFIKHVPEGLNEIKGAIVVRRSTKKANKFALVRGWRILHVARRTGQERINAYITKSGRQKLAKKLRKIERDIAAQKKADKKKETKE